MANVLHGVHNDIFSRSLMYRIDRFHGIRNAENGQLTTCGSFMTTSEHRVAAIFDAELSRAKWEIDFRQQQTEEREREEKKGNPRRKIDRVRTKFHKTRGARSVANASPVQTEL